MKAMTIRKGGAADALTPETLDVPAPGPGQARVRLKAAALNHRDVWQRKAYAGPAPMVLGSDGVGTVDAVGPGDARGAEWVGKDVVINASLYWGDRESAPGPRFQILGNPTPGTYAEYVVVPIENLARKPAHLDFHHAAALPLAGLTAWRALFTQGRLMPGQTVLIPGIGGGVAGLALAFAKRTGARVLVTSSSAQKLKDAREAGADGGVDYRDGDWQDQIRRLAGPDGIDLVIDSTGAATIPAAVQLVKPGGRIVFFGATTGPQVALALRDAYFKQVHLIGTTMGSPREFEALFQFVAATRYVPDVRHLYPLTEAPAAHTLMEAGAQFGKIVLDIP